MNPPARARVLFGLVLLVSVGVVGFLVLRHRPNPSDRSDLPEPSDQATHRTNLVLHAGAWHLPGAPAPFTGLLLDTYEDATRKSLSAISNGLLHGLSLGWHTNGQQQVEEHFVAGTSHGLRTKWHPNGQKLSEVNIVEGKLHGTFRRWDEQGALTEEIEMKDGQPDGVSRAYYASGSLKAEARLEQGRVITSQQWKDGEKKPAAANPAG